MDTYTALSKRVEHLELDKIAQALEITKLKRRVKKLERRNKVKVLKLRRLQKVGTTHRVETFDEIVMDDVSNQGRMIAEMDQDADVVLEDDKEVVDDAKADQDAKVDESVDIYKRQAESQAEIYKIDLEHTNKVLSMQDDESDPAEVQEVVDVVTTAKIITEVVTAASETITIASTTITVAEAQVPAITLTAAPARVTAAPSRRRKGVVIRDPKESTTSTIIPAETKSKDKGELNRIIDWDEVIDHVKKKSKDDPTVKRYQAMKRKPQTEAQARKNMMVYLKNVDGFKMDYFKGMYYDDIRPVFEKHFDSNVAFLQNTKEQIKEEDSRALKRLNETPAEKATKRRKLDEEVEELKRHLQIVPNEDDDDVYTEVTPLALKLILLVERKYPLTRFTLDQMLNVVRLEVEEESEVSLKLLSFGVDAAKGI
uniref:Uncharacterized protein n=1 Tax=Tanacetum cinerariifolium TaxID=118510 RepID=A0A6L2LU05_TANCI|nr:hypothetical protein [Tanacetum cinerariifolium]GEW02697.1 hypothetical protein [Tanacetum cinerariifolium]